MRNESLLAFRVWPRIAPWWLALVVAMISGSVGASTLLVERTIPLPGVYGRIDHLAIDPAGTRLFVAALGNDTVAVIDLLHGKVVRSITGLSEPQGLVFVPEFNRLYVANGGDGTVRVYDGKTYEQVSMLNVGDDADNLRYDASAKRVFVGYGRGALGILDAATGGKVGDIALSAHPESFQLETNGTRVFINLPGSHSIDVVDRTTGKVAASWSPGLAAANFPMALDESQHRLFIACRAPACLVVLDTVSGKELARLDLHGDCDDLFYDSLTQRLYASCGAGYIDVFQSTPDHLVTLKKSIPTAARARTCYFDGRRLFLAVPLTGKAEAEIIEYQVSP